MEQTILTETQRIALAAVASEVTVSHFYLTGGTALAAYYFYHRHSDDLDFFTGEEINAIGIHSFIESLKKQLKASTVRFEKLYDRNQFFFALEDEELKVEFTKYPFPQLALPLTKDALSIDSLRDIAANKLMTLIDRFDPKDFVDMYFLLQTTSLDVICADVEKKFGVQISPMVLGQEFAKVRRVEALPKMIKPLTVDELKTFFTNQAREIGKKVLAD